MCIRDRPLTTEEIQSHNFITNNPVLNIRNLLFYYRLLKDNRFLFGSRGDLIGIEKSSLEKSKNMEQQMKKVFHTQLISARLLMKTHIEGLLVNLSYTRVLGCP